MGQTEPAGYQEGQNGIACIPLGHYLTWGGHKEQIDNVELGPIACSCTWSDPRPPNPGPPPADFINQCC